MEIKWRKLRSNFEDQGRSYEFLCHIISWKRLNQMLKESYSRESKVIRLWFPCYFSEYRQHYLPTVVVIKNKNKKSPKKTKNSLPYRLTRLSILLSLSLSQFHDLSSFILERR